MTPAEIKTIYAVLSRCNEMTQEIYISLMESWFKAGYIVNTTPSSIVLDIPYGNRTARLAILLPGVSEGLAALQPAERAYPSTIILFWEKLRKYKGYPGEFIDKYQKTVGMITSFHKTEFTIHIENDVKF